MRDPRNPSMVASIGYILRHTPNFLIVAGLVFLTLLSAGVSSLLSSESLWLSSWFQNVSAGIAGSVITFLLLQVKVGHKDEFLKLTNQLRSSVNSETIRAAEILQETNWLRDGSLRNIPLGGADLRSANLSDADLRGAFLRNADLRGADLSFTDLRYAYIDETTKFDATTVLPDGTRWKPGTDMSYYTEGRFKFMKVKL